MTAIILAAGVGKRLHAASGGRPKCLIEIGGRSLLQRLLDSLAASGVDEAVVVTGFDAESVRRALAAAPASLPVRTLFNARFREGAILSLATARELLDRPVLIMDADVLCPDAMIERLVRSPKRNCFLLDGRVAGSGEEQMLMARDGRVFDIARNAKPGYDTVGESVGFLKLDAAAARLLRDLLDARIAAGHTGIEHEEVYPELLARVHVGFERADGMPWTEIDFPDDVARAETEVLPRLAPGR